MPMFGLADVNSFYASCEALFRPDLRGICRIITHPRHIKFRY